MRSPFLTSPRLDLRRSCHAACHASYTMMSGAVVVFEPCVYESLLPCSRSPARGLRSSNSKQQQPQSRLFLFGRECDSQRTCVSRKLACSSQTAQPRIPTGHDDYGGGNMERLLRSFTAFLLHLLKLALPSSLFACTQVNEDALGGDLSKSHAPHELVYIY